jgi:threonine synthase
MLRVLRDSGGTAIAVSEQAIVDAQRLIARLEGIWTSPEGAALVAALGQMKDRRDVTGDAEVVMIFTGAGLKYDPPTLAPPAHLEGSPDDAAATIARLIAAA